MIGTGEDSGVGQGRMQEPCQKASGLSGMSQQLLCEISLKNLTIYPWAEAKTAPHYSDWPLLLATS